MVIVRTNIGLLQAKEAELAAREYEKTENIMGQEVVADEKGTIWTV